MFANALTEGIVWTLRRAFKKSKAPIWRVLEEHIKNHRSNKVEVNIDKLANLTTEGDIVIVPGKVLGSGTIDHKLTICTFSISRSAAKKIANTGSNIVTIDYLTEKCPDGNGVRIIG
jgi:large subunit ribosomal protein L18e